ncbi:hypothetical protein VP01_608g4 [Puccinia sorghi]|uniref:Uncharacterized protein n=1 Tax=Puccinia sorghi TaxID=27349 RepID=A0A0L6UH43_9BASI|nr:hypothetical protein VP01_608g4 [Puccinia sorghi]
MNFRHFFVINKLSFVIIIVMKDRSGVQLMYNIMSFFLLILGLAAHLVIIFLLCPQYITEGGPDIMIITVDVWHGPQPKVIILVYTTTCNVKIKIKKSSMALTSHMVGVAKRSLNQWSLEKACQKFNSYLSYIPFLLLLVLKSSYAELACIHQVVCFLYADSILVHRILWNYETPHHSMRNELHTTYHHPIFLLPQYPSYSAQNHAPDNHLASQPITHTMYQQLILHTISAFDWLDNLFQESLNIKMMLALMMCLFAFSKNNNMLPTNMPINQFLSTIFLIYLLEVKKSIHQEELPHNIVKMVQSIQSPRLIGTHTIFAWIMSRQTPQFYCLVSLFSHWNFRCPSILKY